MQTMQHQLLSLYAAGFDRRRSKREIEDVIQLVRELGVNEVPSYNQLKSFEEALAENLRLFDPREIALSNGRILWQIDPTDMVAAVRFWIAYKKKTLL